MRPISWAAGAWHHWRGEARWSLVFCYRTLALPRSAQLTQIIPPRLPLLPIGLATTTSHRFPHTNTGCRFIHWYCDCEGIAVFTKYCFFFHPKIIILNFWAWAPCPNPIFRRRWSTRWRDVKGENPLIKAWAAEPIARRAVAWLRGLEPTWIWPSSISRCAPAEFATGLVNKLG